MKVHTCRPQCHLISCCGQHQKNSGLLLCEQTQQRKEEKFVQKFDTANALEGKEGKNNSELCPMFCSCCKLKTKTFTLNITFEIKTWYNWTPDFKDHITLAINEILRSLASALPGFVFNLFSLMLAYRTKLLIKSPYVSTTHVYVPIRHSCTELPHTQNSLLANK